MVKNVIKVLSVLSFLMFISCGKNEAVRPVGNYNYPPTQPPVQAPPPPNGFPGGGPGYGGPGYPGGGSGYPGGGGYIPPMPPQMPPQMYPFMPVYVVLQPQVFINVWNNWQQQAPMYGCGAYDFSCFWYDYCPNNLGSYDTYNYIDQNYYYWAQPGMQFDPYVDSSYFWGNYSCDGGCY